MIGSESLVWEGCGRSSAHNVSQDPAEVRSPEPCCAGREDAVGSSAVGFGEVLSLVTEPPRKGVALAPWAKGWSTESRTG